MLLKDVVILGTTVPMELKDGRKTVCTAAYHHDHGLIRLYPTSALDGLKRWHPVYADVERNPSDTREESWKLTRSKDWGRRVPLFDRVGVKPIPREDQLEIIDRCAVVCPRDQDKALKSLGILKAPEITDYGFVDNTVKPREVPGYRHEAFVHTRADYALVPKIWYRCGHGHVHEATLLEWGAYEWMRKNPDNLDGYWANVRISHPAWIKDLLIGNQANARTAWIGIGILVRKAVCENKRALAA